MKGKLAILAIITATTAAAQTEYGDVVSAILSVNPDLKAQRELVVAQSYDDRDANSLSNPEIEVEHVWGLKGVGNKFDAGISQAFDWPGVYSARSGAAEKGRQAAEMMVRASEIGLQLSARQLLNELVYVRRQLELNNEIVANLDTLAHKVDCQYDHGELTVLDQRKIRIERFKLDNVLSGLYTRQTQIENELRALCPGVDLNLSQIKYYPISTLKGVEDYVDAVINQDPEVMAQKLNVEMEGMNATVGSRQRWPGFTLGYQFQREQGETFNGFTFAMTLPIFENRYARRAALSRQTAAQLQAESLQAQRISEVRSTYDEAVQLNNQMEGYRQVFGDNAYLRLLHVAYHGGELSVLEYLTELQYYYETKQTYLELDYQYRQNLASLNRYE